MSYNLTIFNPKAAPRGKAEFDLWLSQTMDWEQYEDCNDPSTAAPELRAWFDEARSKFPPMNGQFRLSDEEFDALDRESEGRVTDYAIGTDVIYAAFAFSVAEEAGQFFYESARRHGLGFYDPQTDAVVYFPGAASGFKLSTDDRAIAEPSFEDIAGALGGLQGDDTKFVTLELGDGFIQAVYLPDGTGLFRIEAQPPDTPNAGMPAYYKDVASLEAVADLFNTWFDRGTMPDFSGWSSYDQNQSIDQKNAKNNKLVKALLLIVAILIIIGGIAYIVSDFIQ